MTPPPVRNRDPVPAGGERLLLLLLLLVLLLGVGTLFPDPIPASAVGPPRRSLSAVVPPEPRRVPPLRMPLAGPLVRGFEARAGPYGPGHRGVDIAGMEGDRVRAPVAGTVLFAGPVAGATWISLLAAPGVVVTLGPLRDPAVAAGRPVRARTVLGRVAPGHRTAGRTVDRPGRAGVVDPADLHLSVRVDGVYVDPLVHLVDRPRPRLAPLLAPGGLTRPEATSAHPTVGGG